MDRRPGDVDCRQSLAIVNRSGQGFSLGKAVFEPVILGGCSEYRPQLQSNVDPLSDTFAILWQVCQRLERRLEEGASRLIGRELNRLVTGLAQVGHGFVPERRVRGVVGKHFDHIKRIFLILRFQGAQHARMEHLPLRRNQRPVCNLMD